MNLDDRLRNHMNEQHNAIDIVTPDVGGVATRADQKRQRMVTSTMALVVLLAAGAGMYLLSRPGSDAVIRTDAVAAEDDQSADDDQGEDSDGEAGAEADAVSGATIAGVEVAYSSDQQAPSPWGKRVVDGDVYYVLSTAPGRVKLDDSMTDADYETVFRANTFYVFDDEQGWRSNTVDDRFIADFKARDGVLYAVSTGSADGSALSVGLSYDQGQSWEWSEAASGNPEAAAMSSMALDDDGGITLISQRQGWADWEQAIALGKEAGLDLNFENMLHADTKRLVYLPVPSEDLCTFRHYQILRSKAEFERYLEDVPEEERAIIEAEQEAYEVEEEAWQEEMLNEGNCDPLPEGLTKPEDLPEIHDLEPLTVTWDELGVEVPAAWASWSAMHRLIDGQLVEGEYPFGDGQLTALYHADGLNQAIVYTEPAVDVEYWNGGFSDEADYEEAYRDAEKLWTSPDGETWTEVGTPPEDWWTLAYGGAHYGQGTVAGTTFRINWEAAEEAMVEWEESNAEGGDYLAEPWPAIESTTDGSTWTTIEPNTIFGEIDPTKYYAGSLIETSIGVVITAQPIWNENGPDGPGLVAYTFDGQNWETLETPTNGNWLEVIDGNNEVMLISNSFDEANDKFVDSTILLRPTS